MKICPKCSRSFDDSFSFCLEDGAVLSPSISQPRNEELSAAKTEEFSGKHVVENHGLQKQKSTGVWKYTLAALIIIFIGGLSATFLFFRFGESNNARNRNASNTERVAAGQTVKNTNAATPGNSTKSNAQNNLKTNSANDSTNDLAIKSSPTPEVDLTAAALSKLKQGTSYQKTRELLLDDGWQAVTFSPNREPFSNMKYVIEELGFYEVEDCSGTGLGFCRFLFRDAGDKKLIVVTVNNEKGAPGGPVLSSWTLEDE